MHFLEEYYERVIKYDLINKFILKNINNIPKLEKIVLNFVSKKFEDEHFTSVSLFLELISEKNNTITKTKKTNTFLKLRRGHPVGLKIILNKNLMYYFLSRLLIEISPKSKKLKLKNQKNCLTYHIKDLLIFSELEDYYPFFVGKLPSLQITLITHSALFCFSV